MLLKLSEFVCLSRRFWGTFAFSDDFLFVLMVGLFTTKLRNKLLGAGYGGGSISRFKVAM